MSSSSRFLAWQRKAMLRERPLSVTFELTSTCNLACVMCSAQTRPKRPELDLADWRRTLDELRKLGTLSVTLSGGEPLCHPNFFEIARAARERGFALRVLSNGGLVDSDAADRLAGLRPLSIELSVHGATAVTHDRTTGRTGSFSAVWQAVAELRARDLRVVLKTPVTTLNVHELDALIDRAALENIPLVVDPVLTPRDDGGVHPLRYAISDGDLESVYEVLHRRRALQPVECHPGSVNCGLGRFTLTVDPTGEVYPCVLWRSSSLGNLRDRSLAEMWQGRPRKDLAEVALRCVDVIHREGGVATGFPFCPAIARRVSGDPLHIHEGFLKHARAAAATMGNRRGSFGHRRHEGACE